MTNSEKTKDPFFTSTYEGSRIVLLPYTEDRDLKLIHKMFSNPITVVPLGLDPSKFTIEKLREQKIERMEGYDGADWTIFKKDDEKEYVGEVGLVNWDYETQIVEVFAAIEPGMAGYGYGREAVSVLMEKIFGRSMIALVRAQTLLTNIPAIKLCMSLGFRETGNRAVPPDPEIGFAGGMAVVMDCRAFQFKPFVVG